MQPIVIRGQIELANAARNRSARANRHEPLTLANVLTDLARHGQQSRTGVLNLVERARQGFFRYLGIVAEGVKRLALAFQLLHQIDFEIGTASYFENFKQRFIYLVVMVNQKQKPS